MALLVDDRDLLMRFRAGQAAALTRVFDHYASYITGLLRRGFGFAVGARHIQFHGYRETFDLEDALQEIFRRAFSESARANYDGLRPYKAYLGAIARNTVINAYLANARRLERYGFEEIDTAAPEDYSAADDVLAEEIPSPSGQPARDAAFAELRGLIVAFKNSLAARERMVFDLRFGDGLSHTEIAARSGLSPSKIKTAESRIRKALLRHMHRHGYFTDYHGRPLALPATLGSKG